jgi:predicted nucleotide-binding protein (sugar kinase/HSP70/actin superfamily)
MYGHVLDLMERDIDVLFLPSVMTWMDASPRQEFAHVCPLIPAATWMTTANLDLAAHRVRAVPFTLQFNSPRASRRQLHDLARRLRVSRHAVSEAAAAGERALGAFQADLRRRGEEVLRTLVTAHRSVVVVGRPYNTTDPGASQDLPYKLRRLGVLPIPMDYLPNDAEDVSDTYPDMYWRTGQSILGAAKRIARDPRLEAIYLTNFNCGPDSFLIGFFRRLLEPKPFLELEIDDHTADAGIITRCEAFLDSRAMTARAS